MQERHELGALAGEVPVAVSQVGVDFGLGEADGVRAAEGLGVVDGREEAFAGESQAEARRGRQPLGDFVYDVLRGPIEGEGCRLVFLSLFLLCFLSGHLLSLLPSARRRESLNKVVKTDHGESLSGVLDSFKFVSCMKREISISRELATPHIASSGVSL